jgi:hypothetical protein
VPGFVPSWARPAAPPWPLEQTFAAFHAYCCLSAFAELVPPGHGIAAAAPSLLPMAGERSEEIGDWLLRHGEFLGGDGHTLIEGLLGHRPDSPAAAAPIPFDLELTSDEIIVRRLGSRTLIGRRGRPIELFWVTHQEHLMAVDER